MINFLKNFEGSLKLVDVQPDLIQAIQQQLIKIGLLDSIADGIPVPQKLAAFAKFKKLEYLEHPSILGEITDQALLNATELHPDPNDTATHNVKSAIRFPIVGVAGATQLVPGSNYFTWSELTKRLDKGARIFQGCTKFNRFGSILRSSAAAARRSPNYHYQWLPTK